MIVGSAMTPTTMPAVSAVSPDCRWNTRWTVGRDVDARPRSPSTTDGTAAMNSTIDLAISLRRPPANSER